VTLWEVVELKVFMYEGRMEHQQLHWQCSLRGRILAGFPKMLPRGFGQNCAGLISNFEKSKTAILHTTIVDESRQRGITENGTTRSTLNTDIGDVT